MGNSRGSRVSTGSLIILPHARNHLPKYWCVGPQVSLRYRTLVSTAPTRKRATAPQR